MAPVAGTRGAEHATMGAKLPGIDDSDLSRHRRRRPQQSVGRLVGLLSVAVVYLFFRLAYLYRDSRPSPSLPSGHASRHSPYGQFPRPDDPFLFQPCTNLTLPPPLEDTAPQDTWAALFDPNPDSWSWGNSTAQAGSDADAAAGDPYAGRPIYLCGYLDVPLDYSNASEHRLVRLAVTKLQVSGLEPTHGPATPRAGQKSARTIVVNPGGPGGSGTSLVWRTAEKLSSDLSHGTFDVLGWDPRGVNASLPAISCFPHSAYRDRWSLLSGLYLGDSGSGRAQLEVADAFSEASMRACWERLADLPRFMTTALVARDLEQIRLALGEEELTGRLVSYGTGIGQTYANMFPSSVGRLILDGTEYVRDHRQLGGFGWTALDNATDAWRDGFLGECINAGPDHCALAQPVGPEPLTVRSLDERIQSMLKNMTERPLPAYAAFSGPSLVTYTGIVGAIYSALYNAESWPALAQMLADLEAGNTTLASDFLEQNSWNYDPDPEHSHPPAAGSSWDLGLAVICGDSYDAPLPAEGLDWWDSLRTNMTRDSWIAGDSRFYDVLPCRHYTTYWPEPAEVYRGDLDHALRNPVLLIAETYDPATPLRNGRRLLAEMGRNARLVVHHGYGHSSRDRSSCTDSIARSYILDGVLPDEAETECYADGKPYLYAPDGAKDHVRAWRDHIAVMQGMGPIFTRP